MQWLEVSNKPEMDKLSVANLFKYRVLLTGIVSPVAALFFYALVFFGMLDAIPILLIAFDLWSRRKIHLVTINGTLLLLVMQFSMRPLGHSAFWHQFTAWVQSR
jgi:hypothetical protein